MLTILRQLFQKSPAQPTQNKLPDPLVLLDGKLKVHVFAETLTIKTGTIYCLTYKTEGLAAVGQQEILFALKTAKPPQAIVDAPVNFFKQLYQLAEKGIVVGSGGFTTFGQGDLLGWKGAIYADYTSELADQSKTRYLTMLLATKEEVEAIRRIGYMRLLSMLGARNRFYPFPFWSDLTRSPLPISEILSKSFISKIGSVALGRSTITLEKSTICWRVPREENSGFKPQEVLPLDKPVVIFPSLSPNANACLSYDMTSNEPLGITRDESDGSRMGGCFIVFNPGQPHTMTKIVEDGFYVGMSNENWEALWESFTQKSDLFIPAQEKGMHFSLQFE